MTESLLFAICLLGAVAALGVFVSRLFVTTEDAKLRQRLGEAGTMYSATPTSSSSASGAATLSGATVAMRPMLERISSAVAYPFMPSSRERQSSLRKDLGYAGIYSPSASKIVTGAKVILMAGGVGVGYAAGAVIEQP